MCYQNHPIQCLLNASKSLNNCFPRAVHNLIQVIPRHKLTDDICGRYHPTASCGLTGAGPCGHWLRLWFWEVAPNEASQRSLVLGCPHLARVIDAGASRWDDLSVHQPCLIQRLHLGEIVTQHKSHRVLRRDHAPIQELLPRDLRKGTPRDCSKVHACTET